jgi:hypothetical protein
MSFPPQQVIGDAIHLAENERDILDDEQTAYRRFVGRLDEIGVTGSGSATAIGVSEMQTISEPVSVDKPLQAAREAYRETVMATQHYETEYGESLREHVAAEFGSAVATQFVDGCTLTPLLQQSLRDGAAEAIQQRAELLKSLRSERRSLRRFQDTVADVQDHLNEVHMRLNEEPDATKRREIDTQLAALESECETVLARRQQHIDSRSRSLLIDDNTGFAEYLYDGLDSHFPILTATTECIETIRTCRIRNLQ